MATTTKETATATVPPISQTHLNEMLLIADASEIKRMLSLLFDNYVWNCVSLNYDEELHHEICFIYHGLIHLLDRLPERN